MCRVATLEIECCAHCKLGRWRVVEQRRADRAAIAASCSGDPARGRRHEHEHQLAPGSPTEPAAVVELISPPRDDVQR